MTSRRSVLSLPMLAMLPSRARSAGGLDAALQTLVDDPLQPLASLAVQLQHRGRVIYQGQFGRRYISADGRSDLPVTADTLFRVASVSKLVVGVGVMRLVEAGRLDLDADISEHLGYKLRNPQHPDVPITMRQLLSHLSSLRDNGGAYFTGDKTLQSVLVPGGEHYGRGLSWAPAAPGTWYQYCNLNYPVIASVMERASGQRFDRFMQAEVFGPLGMQGGFDPAQFTATEILNTAVIYRKRQGEIWDSAGPWVAQVDDLRAEPPKPMQLDSYVLGSNGSLFAPQGRVRTRVQDLGKLMAMLLAGGEHAGRTYLRPASVQAMMSEQWRHEPSAGADKPDISGNGDNLGGLFQAWGMGLQHFIDRSRPDWGDRLVPAGGLQAWGSLGFAYGLHAGLVMDPKTRSGITYVIGGEGADPGALPGRYSSFPLFEERLQALLWNEVLKA